MDSDEILSFKMNEFYYEEKVLEKNLQDLVKRYFNKDIKDSKIKFQLKRKNDFYFKLKLYSNQGMQN